MIDEDSIVTKKIKHVFLNKIIDREDVLAMEEPLEIQLSYMVDGIRVRKSISVTMRTPGNDEELAVGFLFTEGIIQQPGQIKDARISALENNKVLVTLNDGVIPNLSTTERNFYTTSSCGVCGKSSIDSIKTNSVYGTQNHAVTVKSHVLLELIQVLEKQQSVFLRTGGLHASALFDLEGTFLLLREDVGRHNALDKVLGSAFLKAEMPLNNSILLLSGRASFELIQKATMAGIQIIVAIGAPSSLAVQLAEESGITLAGFMRKETFNIYSGYERIETL